MDLSGADLDNVTRTILAEAGQNATPASMAAVASVIRNRVAAGGYGGSPSGVVHSPNQFEPWNPGSGNDPSRFDPDSSAYKTAAALAQGVFTGVVKDPTQGATHFFSPAGQAALGRSRPAWAGSPPTAEIGGHQFFAPSGPVTGDQIAQITSTPGVAPGGPETTTPYSGPGSQPTPGQLQNQAPRPLNVPVPPVGQTQLAALLAGMQGARGGSAGGSGGGGGLLGNLLFGRQGIMGLFPQEIQQRGIVGSAFNGLGGALRGVGGSQGGNPPGPPPTQQMASAAPAPSLPLQSSAPPPGQPAQPTSGQSVIPGQTNPHLPGFDPSSIQFLGKKTAMNDDGGAGLLTQLL